MLGYYNITLVGLVCLEELFLMVKVRYIVLVMVLLSLLVPSAVMAQEPGSGGPIIEGNGGTSVGSLNYWRCAGSDCRNVVRWLYPGLTGTDPELQIVAPGDRPGVLATDWTIDDTGLIYTYTLRNDMVWSDGEPVTGWDYQFTYFALKYGADAIETPYGYVVADMSDVAVSEDGLTLTVTFDTASCQNLTNSSLAILPGHAFGWTPDMGQDFDWSVMVGHEFDTAPTVSAGPFVFSEMDSERVVLTTNENYVGGPVIPSGYIYPTVPDQTVMAERFIAGELNYMENPQQAKRQEMRDNDSIQTYDFPGATWDYVLLNLGNPDNPQPGVELDADGNVVYDENDLPVVVEQEAHPLFGDVRVRRALQMAINTGELLEKAVLGEGTIMAANELPNSWALNPDLAPIGYDPAAASALLAEAGWTPGDDGILVNADGLRFSFELLTNDGNTRRTQAGELMQAQLAEIGIEVDFQAIDFNQMLEIIDAQTFDAIHIAWGNGYPIDPDQTGIFTSDGDVPGGFNGGSYTNPEIDRLMKEGLNVPGCTAEGRAAVYGQIQEILQADQPYLWLYALNSMYAASASVDGFNPYDNEPFWNAETWTIAQ
jgi:peptide/nickel transport system substrate-binding protein